MSFLSKTWVIIPVHNRRELTLEALEHLRDTQDFDTFETILVDDGSTDGTSEAITSEFPSVHLIEGDGNLWWTGSVRKGMAHALENGAEVIVWLNDDVRPEKGHVERLASAVDENPEKMLCAVTRRDPPNNMEDSWGNRRIQQWYGPEPVEYDHSVEFQLGDMIAGKFTAMHRSLVEDIGLPDADTFPHHHGDLDYSLRAKEYGYEPAVYTPVRATDVGEREELSHDTRLSPGSSFETVLKDTLDPNRHSGYDYYYHFRTDRRFVPYTIVSAALFLYHVVRTTGALGVKFILCLIRSDQRLTDR